MKKLILILIFLMTITPAFAVCNITDNTYINSDTILVANETPCNVADSDSNGVIVITADDVILDCGTVILNGSYGSSSVGINITGFNNTTIKNCYVNRYEFGIYFESSENNTIQNITVNNDGYGIYIDSSCNYNFMDNITSNNNEWSGISMYAPNGTIINSYFNNSNYGIDIRYGNNSLINTTSTANENYGFYIRDCNPCNITNITANSNNGAGVYFNNLDNTTISSSNITDANSNPDGVGIRLVNSDNNTIENMTLNNNSYGILLSGQNNNVSNLTLTSNTYGISVSGSYNNVTNIISTSNTYGIILDASYTNVTNLTLTSNTYGISITGSPNNTVSNLTSTSNTYGASIGNNVKNLTLDNNNFTNNTYNLYINFGSAFDWNKTIYSNNTVDGKSIYYLKNVNDVTYNASDNIGTFYCYNCSNITIENIIFNNTGNAIEIWDSNETTIQNVTINWTYKGIYLKSNVRNITINNTNIDNVAEKAIYLGEGSNSFNSTITNVLIDNIGSSGQGIGLNIINNNTLENITTNYGSKGIYVDTSNYSSLNNITAQHAEQAGIHFQSTFYSNVTNSLIYNCTQNDTSDVGSLRITLTSRFNYFINNTITNNGEIGVTIYSGSNSNNVIDSNVSFNGGAGFDIDSSNSNNVTNNTISSNNPNDSGIYNDNANYTRVENNTFVNNTFGVTLRGAINGTIHNNTIQNSSNTSIYFYGASGNHTITNNTICYNNIFLLNTSTLGNHLIDNNTFCVDAIAPLNNSILPYVPAFTVNASNPMYTGSPNSTSCQLYVNSVYSANNQSIYDHNASRIIYLVNTPGVYNWYVYCNDSATTNWGNSSVYYFTIAAGGGGGGGGGGWITPPENKTNVTKEPTMNSSIESNLTLNVNGTGSVLLNITRQGNETCCTMINITGIPDEWLLTNLGQFSIEVNETKTINLTFNPDKEGEYPINITIITPDINQTLPFKLIVLKRGEIEPTCIKPWWLIIPIELEYPDCYIPTWLIIIPGVLYYGYRHPGKSKSEKKKPSFWKKFKRVHKEKPRKRPKRHKKKSKRLYKRKLSTREKLILLDRTHKERISVF